MSNKRKFDAVEIALILAVTAIAALAFWRARAADQRLSDYVESNRFSIIEGSYLETVERVVGQELPFRTAEPYDPRLVKSPFEVVLLSRSQDCTNCVDQALEGINRNECLKNARWKTTVGLPVEESATYETQLLGRGVDSLVRFDQVPKGIATPLVAVIASNVVVDAYIPVPQDFARDARFFDKWAAVCATSR